MSRVETTGSGQCSREDCFADFIRVIARALNHTGIALGKDDHDRNEGCLGIPQDRSA